MRSETKVIKWEAGSREVGPKDNKRTEKWEAGSMTATVEIPETWGELVTEVTRRYAARTGERLEAGECAAVYDTLFQLVTRSAMIDLQTVRLEAKLGKDVPNTLSLCQTIADSVGPRPVREKQAKSYTAGEIAGFKKAFALFVKAGTTVEDIATMSDMTEEEVTRILA